MKTPSLALVGLVLALAFAAPPAGAKVVSKPAGESPASVRAYWTAERMRSARPVERMRPQEKGKPGGGGGGTSTDWSTLPVDWTTAPAITVAHGKVFFSDGAYNYVCSGTAITGSSGSVAWTAGHCVNEGPGAFYTNWMFVPAYNRNGITEPYGKFPATKLFTTSEWQTQANAYGRDLGAAHTATNASGQTLATALGGQVRGLNTSGALATGTRVDSFGYPAAGKYNGRDEYHCDSYISRRDTSTTPADYGIPCGMTGGSSGGGWVGPGGTVASVNSYGYSSIKNTMFGPVQDSVAAALQASANAG